jgi:hypothetical protein
VGRATALLKTRPALALGALLLLGAYYASSEFLPDVPQWVGVLWIGFVISALASTSVWLALPLRRERLLLPAVLAFAAIAVALYLIGADLYASLPKLAAAALIGFLFLRYFEKLSWVVLLALLIPAVDTISVWRGPTHYVVTEKPQVFNISSVAFPVPGERTITIRWQAPPASAVSGWRIYRRIGSGREQLLAPNPFCPPKEQCGKKLSFSDGAEPSGKKISYRVSTLIRGVPQYLATVVLRPAGEGAPLIAQTPSAIETGNLRATSAPTSAGLGLSDVLFFALFLGAAARFGLRRRATWLALVCSLGLTTVLAVYADPFKTSGLPALPGVSLAFLLVNADLIWRRFRGGDEIDVDFQARPEQPER